MEVRKKEIGFNDELFNLGAEKVVGAIVLRCTYGKFAKIKNELELDDTVRIIHSEKTFDENVKLIINKVRNGSF